MKTKTLFIFALIALILSGCSSIGTVYSTPTPQSEDSSWPTPASSLPELLEDIAGDDTVVQEVSIYALQYHANEPEIILPVLIEKLRSRDSDVREAAAFVLGKMGPNAKEAVPGLLDIVLSDDFSYTRVRAAEALGLIGDRRAVPALASVVLEEKKRDDFKVAIHCAISISWITGEEFTDADFSGSYGLNEDSVPYLVIDTREWWEQTGQYQDWDESE